MRFGKLKQKTGIVHINKLWCKGCGFCVKYCPTGVLELSKEYNHKGYHPPYVKHADQCRLCKFCEVICPEFTIYVTDEEEENHSA